MNPSDPTRAMPDRGSGSITSAPIFHRLLTTFLSIFFVATSALAESQPKIGLALSGGGARGFGHIGVLQALEELRIPVHYIAGTSIGSFIGGLYASGYTAEEIHKITHDVDWDSIIGDNISRTYLPLRRKYDLDRSLAGLEIGFRDWKFLLPPGINYGRNWSFLLESLFTRVADKKNFSNLPIPYRAVAMNIENGNTVILDQGYLPDAIRASSALPGIFSPVEIDGKLLIDGGPLNNLPINVLRKMGATVVIAVNIAVPLKNKEDLQSVLGVTEQTINAIVNNNAKVQLKNANVVITPDLGDAGVLSYSSAEEMIESGRTTTLETTKLLKAYQLSAEAYGNYEKQRTSAAYRPTTVNSVTVTGVERVDPRTIKRQFRTTSDTDLDLETLHEDLKILNALGDFEIVDFEMKKKTDEQADMTIRAKEKAWGPNYIRFGFDYTGELDSRDRFGLSGSFLMTRLNPLGGEWNNHIAIGTRLHYETEFYQPLTYSGNLFTSVQGTIFRDSEEIYNPSGTRVSGVKTHTGAGGAALGIVVNRRGELRLGLWSDWTDSDADPAVTLVPQFKGLSFGPRAEFVIDTLDHSVLPKSGFLLSARAFSPLEEMGSVTSYLKASSLVATYLTRSRHTVFATLEGGTSFGSNIPAYTEFLAGGLGSLSGYRRGELRGQHFAFGRAGYRYRLTRSPLFLILNQADLGGYAEVGNVWAQSSDIKASNLKVTGTVFLGLDTKLGPIFFAYGQEGISKFQFYVTIGGTSPLSHFRN